MDDRSRKVSPSMLSIPDLQFERPLGSPLRLLHRGSKSPSPTLASTPPEREPFTYDAWSSMTPPAFDEPDIEQMAQSIMTRLLTDPLRDLPASYSSSMMRIIESHTKFRLENKRLRVALDDAEQRKHVLENDLARAQEKLLAHDIPFTPQEYVAPSRHDDDTFRDDGSALFEPDRLIESLRSVSPSTTRFPLISSPKLPETPQDTRSRNDRLSPLNAKPLPETPDRSRNASSTSLAALRRLATLPTHEHGPQRNASKENAKISPARQMRHGSDLVKPFSIDPGESSSVAVQDCSTASKPSRLAARPQERTFSFHRGDDSSFHHRPLETHEGAKPSHGRAPSKSLPGATQQSKQPLEQANTVRTASSAPKTNSESEILERADSTPLSPIGSPTGTILSKSRIPSPTYQGAQQTPLRPRRETNGSIQTAIQHGIPIEPGSSLLGGSFATVDAPRAEEEPNVRKSK